MTYLPLGHGLRQHFLGPQVKPGGQEPFVGTLSLHGGEVAAVIRIKRPDWRRTAGPPDHSGGSRRRLIPWRLNPAPGRRSRWQRPGPERSCQSKGAASSNGVLDQREGGWPLRSMLARRQINRGGYGLRSVRTGPRR